MNDPEWNQWSDREIAKKCCVSNRFVSNLRHELTVNGSQSAIRLGADGRKINTSKIGKIAKQNTIAQIPRIDIEAELQPMNKVCSRPEYALLEVKAEIMPDDSLPDSTITEQIQAQSTYTEGDRVRILRRQMGQDEWCGEIAKVCNLADDGWLRVDVEGHPGVRFTLHPDWVEPIDEVTRETNMSESTANKASNDPIRVVLPVEIEGQQVNVEGIVTAVDVAYMLNGQSHQINLPADKIVFPR